MNRLIFICFFIFCFTFLFSAQKDSIADKSHPYKKSMMFSAILPGAGQIRNSLLSERRYKPAFWKVPLIYSTLGATGYFIYNNHLTQNRIKEEYYNRLNGNPASPDWESYDNFGLVALQKQFLNNRDLLILLTLAIYGVQIIDAGVEAHFLKFDVSEDLSIRLSPYFNTYNAGVGLNFRFR